VTRPGDLIVAMRHVTRTRAEFDAGTVTRVDGHGQVTAYERADGTVQPVAWLRVQPLWSRVVDQDSIDTTAAMQAARDTGGVFPDLAAARAAWSPFLRTPAPRQEAEREAGQ
jgi:hypothetical protein